jgi:hypothetical protein
MAMKVLVFWDEADYKAASTQTEVNWEKADSMWVESSNELNTLFDQAYRVWMLDGHVECSSCGKIIWGAVCECEEE